MTGFIGTSLQLQSIITAHNQWLLKTGSIPYWATSVFSSTVTDLVLIHESVNSSASVVRWLTLHSWTLNYSYEWIRMNWVELSFMLRPTVSRPVSLGIKHPFGAYDQIFVTCVTVTVLILWGALSDERTGLSFIYAAGPCPRSLSLVRVPWDSQIWDFPFRRLLRLAGSRWRYSIPPPHGKSEWIQKWTLFYNSGRAEERPPPRTVCQLLSVFFSVAMKRA
jgi:hypothetical protein